MGSKMVQVGTFGEIKKTMRLLSKRDSHIDMEFVCGENQDIYLQAHRFIIGAQSRYLKSIMESTPLENEKTMIYLPGVERKEMEVVLQFLYTGKMKLTKSLVQPVRILLEEVLRIDADFKMPPAEDFLAGQDNNENDRNGDGGCNNGHEEDPNPSSFDSTRSNSSKEPPRKRQRPSSGTNGAHSSHYNYGPIQAPMTPPHDLDEDNEDIQDPPTELCDNEVENQNTNSSEIHNDKTNLHEQADEATNISKKESENLSKAQTVFAKKSDTSPITNGKRQTARKKTGASRVATSNPERIPDAPKIVTKRTGKHPSKSQNLNAKSSLDSTLSPQNSRSASPSNSEVHSSEHNESPVPSPPQFDSQNNDHENYDHETEEYETNGIDQREIAKAAADAFNNPTPSTSHDSHNVVVELSDDDFETDYVSDPSYVESLPQLPPPLPQPPEKDAIMYRGQWIKRKKYERIIAQQERKKQIAGATGQVRRYNWSTASITGRKLNETDIYRSEPEGRHECAICGVVFTHTRSLQVHFTREHNPRATVPCPENCGKMFTSKGAIKKHLLSHRPEHEWPFVCLFCGKHFQARADLPKHFLTNQHANDPRIPKAGTAEWKELMKKSEVVPWKYVNPGNQPRPTAPVPAPPRRSNTSWDSMGSTPAPSRRSNTSWDSMGSTSSTQPRTYGSEHFIKYESVEEYYDPTVSNLDEEVFVDANNLSPSAEYQGHYLDPNDDYVEESALNNYDSNFDTNQDDNEDEDDDSIPDFDPDDQPLPSPSANS